MPVSVPRWFLVRWISRYLHPKGEGAWLFCVPGACYEIAEIYLVVSGDYCIFAPMKAKRLIGLMVVGMLVFLAGCSGDKAQMLQQLEQLEQQNRSGEAMLNDSLAESLVNYFDRHGDANERMRSRYILGRTYYCLDELPRALETYNEAADCADTTSADCNYKVLSRIHAQSAVIFQRL